MNNLLVHISLIFCSIALSGQEGIFYYGVNGIPVTGEAKAVIYQKVHHPSDYRYRIRTCEKNGEDWRLVKKEYIRIRNDSSQAIRYRTTNLLPKKMLRLMDRKDQDTYLFTELVKNRISRTGTSSRYLPLFLEGTVREYYPNNELKSVSWYTENQLTGNENWLPDGSRYIDSIYYSVDQEPEYTFGNTYFHHYLRQYLLQSDFDFSAIQDEVIIGWVVMEDGSINGIRVLKGRIRELNELLVQAISELPGTWEPAELDGRKVRYFVSVPLGFNNNTTTFQDIQLSGGIMHYNKY